MKHLKIISLLVAASLLGLAGQSSAVPIANPSFETATVPGIPDNWTFTLIGTGMQGGQDPSPAIGFAGGYTGSAIGFVYWDGSPGTGVGTVSQTLVGTSAQPNTTYILSVDIGYRDDAPGGYVNTLPAPDPIDIKLFAGASELAGGVYMKPSLVYRNFVTYTATYNVGAVAPLGDLGVRIIGDRTVVMNPPPGFNPQNHNDLDESFFPFDNVVLTTVPEPGTLGMMLVGVAVCCIRARMRARSQRIAGWATRRDEQTLPAETF